MNFPKQISQRIGL